MRFPFRVFLVISGLIALLLAVGCSPSDEVPESQEVSRNVRVLPLESESLVEYFEVSGPVSPVLGTDLSVEESGPVIALPVVKGRAVEEGDLLLELDRTILKAEMESAASQLRMQEFNIDKIRQLFAAEKISRLELLTAEAQYEQAKSMNAVSARRYQRAGLRAPFAGILTDRYVELGQLVIPGQVAVRLIDPHVLKLEAYLTGGEVGWVQVGQHADIFLADAGAPVVGTVSWIGLEADRQTGKFRIEIEIPNEEVLLHAGIIGRASLQKRVLNGAVVIPRDAILPGSSGASAFVVNGDRAELRSIELGADQGVLVQVESGLEKGDRLVVRGHRELRDGSLVKVTETATAVDGSMAGDPDRIRSGAEVPR
jgi:membrane fusion protein, multidrug efflux system